MALQVTGVIRNLTLGVAARQARQGGGCPCPEPSPGATALLGLGVSPGGIWDQKAVLPLRPASQIELELPPMLGSVAGVLGQHRGTGQVWRPSHGGCWMAGNRHLPLQRIPAFQ